MAPFCTEMGISGFWQIIKNLSKIELGFFLKRSHLKKIVGYNVNSHFSSWSATITRKATEIMKRLKTKQISHS